MWLIPEQSTIWDLLQIMSRSSDKGRPEISFESSVQVMHCSEDVRLLWRLGRYISTHGVRRDFDAAITDYYLGRGGIKALGMDEAQDLRALTMDLDAGIEAGLLYPRLEKIRELINKINI